MSNDDITILRLAREVTKLEKRVSELVDSFHQKDMALTMLQEGMNKEVNDKIKIYEEEIASAIDKTNKDENTDEDSMHYLQFFCHYLDEGLKKRGLRK